MRLSTTVMRTGIPGRLPARVWAGIWAGVLAGCTFAVQQAHAAERVMLRNGFSLVCDHRELVDAGHVRLFLDRTAGSYMDVPAAEIAEVGAEAEAPSPTVAARGSGAGLQRENVETGRSANGGAADVDALIRSEGRARNLNVDLLRSVVNAESGGKVRAVSRAGAQGLMQLMPATAKSLGVADSFAAEENLRGGSDYLDGLLRRYHDDLALALAAYNAGPAAVDRYHGVPPYRETRLYVARIIREFNRRTLLAQKNSHSGSTTVEVAAAR